jgi:hypothetical protein
MLGIWIKSLVIFKNGSLIFVSAKQILLTSSGALGISIYPSNKILQGFCNCKRHVWTIYLNFIWLICKERHIIGYYLVNQPKRQDYFSEHLPRNLIQHTKWFRFRPFWDIGSLFRHDSTLWLLSKYHPSRQWVRCARLVIPFYLF